MISSKKIMSMAMRWKRVAIGRRRITLTKTARNLNAVKSCKSSIVAAKGHFAVYTSDARRYMIPLAYLSYIIFRELLHMAEEEYGLPTNGPIVLPCDSIFMDYILSVVRRGNCDDIEQALVISLGTGQCFLSSSHSRSEICSQNIIKGF